MASGSRPRRNTSRAHYGEDSDSEEISRPSLRSPRNRPNYLVDASSDSEASDSAESVVVVPPPSSSRQSAPRRIPTRSTIPRPPKRKLQSSRSKPFTSFKRRKAIGAPIKQKHSSTTETEAFIRPGGKVPPWQILEHGILTEIFKKASYPLYTSYLRPRASVQWLVGISYLSKSFHDAAISALLFSPPLVPYANGLLTLLNKDQESLSTNYRVKLRKLVVEAKHVLVKKGGISDLSELVSLAPLLESLRIVSYYDELSTIWARPSAAKKTYSYQQPLFSAIEVSCPRLKEFEWNGRFGGTADVIDMIFAGHMPGLTSVKLINLNLPGKISDEERLSLEQRLISGLNRLLQLEYLKITNCDVLDNFASLASLHSSQLNSLAIIDCPSLTSAGLEAVLEAKGSQLEQLHLISCQSCDGGFLASLSQYTPRLRTLQIDLTFTDVTSYHDVNAHFEDFLPLGSISFPSTLVEIDINNLRKVTDTQLEACLETLITSDLPRLRRLSIKAILTISDYRVRARIRNEWRDKLDQVFRRRSAPPASNIQVVLPVRRRIEAPNESSTSDESRKRYSSRISGSVRSKVAVTENATAAQLVSGRIPMCDLVEFRVDDQRPADSQYAEDDFLDDELSGDDDWNGRE